MASKVEIANLALSQLGAQRITSFTDNTNSAKLINAIYDEIVDEVTGSYAWTSATKRFSLNKLSTAPNHFYKAQFQLPTNPKILKLLEVYDGSTTDVDYRIEGDRLLTDVSAVSIKYIGRLTDSEAYGIHLQTAIVARLVAAMTYNFTGSANIARQNFELYRIVIDEMRSADAGQGDSDIVICDDLINIRK